MVIWRPDPSFYPSPRMAMQGPQEKLAYVAVLNANAALNSNGDGRPDALAVFDLDPDSRTYGQVVGRVDMPNTGDELHHFGWNACSSALCPYAPHPHIERRYLIVPGLRSSRMHIIDTKPVPREPRIVKVIEPDELHDRTGYSRPHTIHCGPEGIYVSALGAPDGDGPGGVFIMDHESFEPLGRWEVDRGPQYFAYDFWWHLVYDTMITSEWGTPNMIEGGLNPEILMQSGYGHRLHVWDLRRRRHLQALDLGDEYQIVLELRPAHNPNKTHGGAGRPGPAATCLEGLRCGAAPNQRHQPLSGRQVPLCLLLGHRGAQAVRCLRPVQPETHRIRPPRRDGTQDGAPEGRPTPKRGAADGRAKPGRAQTVLQQLAVCCLGCAVLSRRYPRLDRQAGRRSQRRPHHRHRLLHRVR